MCKFKEKGELIIHWLPKAKGLVKTKIMMPDATYIEGLCESGVSKLKKGDVVQFERFGFVRVDEKKKGEIVFWFGHK